MMYYTPDQTDITEQRAYVYASVVAFASAFSSLTAHNYMQRMQEIGMSARVACCSLVYRKCLRLSRKSLVETTTGKMVNLLSNDVSRFDTTVSQLMSLVLAPIYVVIVLYLMSVYAGLTACAGLATYVAYVPLQRKYNVATHESSLRRSYLSVFMAKKISTFRFNTAVRTDERVRLMNEIITGIKVIKMYTWEKPFAKLVALARKLEIKEIRGTSYTRGVMLSFSVFSTRLAAFASILVYVLTDHSPTAYYVFVVTSFYNGLRQVLTMQVPQGMTLLAELNISVRRIQNFLEYEEIHRAGDNQANGLEMLPRTPKMIRLKDATAKWNAALPDDTLSNITLEVPPKQLLAVVGSVGSGKSSLLQVILRELPLSHGEVGANGTISFASQEPWLFTGTVKDNILFGLPFDPNRYKEVVNVCALQRDFSLFPFGDRSVVGERGVLLSGGQKARIGLARAVYREADIYLLDDPLSAVDTHVGKQLFEECIRGFLRDKCVVLVTHQLQYLADVDNIVLLENGRVAAKGSYRELQEVGHFGRLINKKGKDGNEKQTNGVSEESCDKNEGPKEVKEHRSKGNVDWKIYAAYMNAGGGIYIAFSAVLFFIVAQACANGADYFITFW